MNSVYPAIQTRCFKAYDIRGQVPTDLDDDIAYRIGRALVLELGAKNIVVGRDMRLESPPLAQALMKGIQDAGADVIDIGLCGTEEVYFATSHYEADGGVMVTASHNPKGYNGMKLVKGQSRPISGDTGLDAIRERVDAGNIGDKAERPGRVDSRPDKAAYIKHLLSYVSGVDLRPLKILADPGMARSLQRATQPGLVRGTDHLHQHPAHPAGDAIHHDRRGLGHVVLLFQALHSLRESSGKPLFAPGFLP